MKDDELNAAIAHECGWSNCRLAIKGAGGGSRLPIAYGNPPGKNYEAECPFYTTDLNAIAAAVAAMPDWWQDRFTIALTRECGSHKLAVNAPARKRAQVFVALCQKWPEATATKTATTPADVQKSQQS